MSVDIVEIVQLLLNIRKNTFVIEINDMVFDRDSIKYQKLDVFCRQLLTHPIETKINNFLFQKPPPDCPFYSQFVYLALQKCNSTYLPKLCNIYAGIEPFGTTN